MMKRLASQTLDTTQFVGDDDSIGCVCCSVQYPGTGNHCNRCQAPLEISTVVRSRGAPPRFVSVLGASGAGKTVYLGLLLDLLSKGHGGLSGVANGSFSIAVQLNAIGALERRHFPEKTPSEADQWHWIHCEVTSSRQPKRPWDIVTPDFAGEAISLEIEQPGSYPAIRSVVGKSAGVLMLCDAISACRAPLHEDIFALKLATYIQSAQDETNGHSGKGGRQGKNPVAVVFTKCDQCPEVRDDPERFAANNLPRLLQYCQRGFSEYRFFAASAVSHCATLMDDYGCSSEIALHVEPRGVVEPLQWICA